ncbi:MAG: hypothetical protein KY469_10570 [Actinobacteria bacterium]|nr:hypothetical protein [Actinomycetota bacterium]
MTDLIAFTVPETPADAVAEIARVKAAESLIAGHDKAVRAWLEPRIRDLSEQAGGQFTLRADAGTAVIQGGNAKPRITDADAFADWCRDVDDTLVEQTERVEVIDHQAVITAITDPRDPTRSIAETHADRWHDLVAALKIVTEWRVADGAVEGLLDRGLLIVLDGYCVDTTTGEKVPGVAVTYSREMLVVRPDKKLVSRLAAEMAPSVPELDGGES